MTHTLHSISVEQEQDSNFSNISFICSYLLLLKLTSLIPCYSFTVSTLTLRCRMRILSLPPATVPPFQPDLFTLYLYVISEHNYYLNMFTISTILVKTLLRCWYPRIHVLCCSLLNLVDYSPRFY